MTTTRTALRSITRRLTGLAPLASLLVGGAFLLTSTEAGAQEWMKDRRYQEGAGLRAGDVELHPGIGGEIGYDSNWLLRTHRTGFVNSNPEGAGILRITPSFAIATLGPQRLQGAEGPPPLPPSVQFRGGVSATYREFFGADEIQKQRNVSAEANARLDILPQRPVGFGLFAGWRRLIQPQSAAPSNPDLSFNRNDVNGGGEIIFIPGGGTLDMRLGYQASASLYEESNGVPYTSTTHELSFRDRWRFRPRTALFSDTTLRWTQYPNADRATNFLNDATPFRTRIGLTGLLSDRFGTLLAVGYGATFFRNGPAVTTLQYDSVNAQAEGTFYLSGGAGAGEPGQATLLLSTLTFGVVRDFQMSLLSNYYTSNKAYARVVYFFGGKTLLQLDGYGEQLEYPQPFILTAAGPAPAQRQGGGNIGDFTNYRVGVSFFAEHRLSDIFALNGTISYDEMISDTSVPSGGNVGGVGTPQAGYFDLAWRRFQAFVGARLFW